MASDFVGRHGPLLRPGGVRFNLWAPAARSVELLLEGNAEAMQREAGGWYAAEAASAKPGQRYIFRIDGTRMIPDPASHFQPEDVHGPAELIDHDYAWRCTGWRGRPWHEAVLYELHIGSFSAEGTFLGAIRHLDHLADLGISAIELMPVADFSGGRNWGYDGVLLFAPDSAYGRPEDLKALIDAAHERGMMVFLDVVYNHFGPDGNYLPDYAPAFFTEVEHTPWGAAIDYRRPEVRAFAIQNALHWLEKYRFDGLRLDAVHAIKARGEPDILIALAEAVTELAAASGRHIHLVLENDDNNADLLDPARHAASYRGQWNDDYHHAWHVLLTGERQGYYADYAEPMPLLRKALRSGFVYQGEASGHRGGLRRGQASGKLPPSVFVNFLQNHDQIGNRPFGDRLTAKIAKEPMEAALAILLLAPFQPLLFMGEEWGSRRSFPFFCDFSGALADAVRRGRREEFAQAYVALQSSELPPDALETSSFAMAKLDWTSLDTPDGKERLTLIRRLLAVRHRMLMPLLADPGPLDAGVQDIGTDTGADALLRCEWRLGPARLTLQANLSDAPMRDPSGPGAGRQIWGEAIRGMLPPWHVAWWLED